MRVVPGKPEALILLAAAWMALACNAGFWAVALNGGAGGAELPMASLAGLVSITVGLTAFIVLLLSVGRLTRPLLATLLVVAAGAGYFTARFGVVIDTSMLVNLVETDPAEAAELVSPRFLLTVFLLGVVPAVLVLRTRLPRRRFAPAAAGRAAGLAIALALVAAPLLLHQKAILSVLRNHHELARMLAPLNVLAATWGLARDELSGPETFRHVALDAAVLHDAGDDRPTVHVIVVGETARAANFSMNGYGRDTNPELAALPVIYFPDVETCGTATAQSLPCMFSLQTAAEYDRREAGRQDNLLDVAARAGYDVIWIENGNSCKGVCARVPTRDVSGVRRKSICENARCYDEKLVAELDRVLDSVDRDTLVVLHQLGSHGPAYFRRYPDEFRRFVPDCRSNDLGNCSAEEIRNAYDNTILYADHVIARAIDSLAARSDRVAGSLLYVSDHGESLGEHNLFLHGMPRGLAPDEQTQVPMIAWMSDATLRANGIDAECGEAVRREDVSHDNLFHTELGLLGISTTAYEPGLDVFSGCRRQLHVRDDERDAADTRG